MTVITKWDVNTMVPCSAKYVSEIKLLLPNLLQIWSLEIYCVNRTWSGILINMIKMVWDFSTHVLAQSPFTTIEADLDFYHQKLKSDCC